MYALGEHYPCKRACPRTAEVGLKFWASEDYSTVADVRESPRNSRKDAPPLTTPSPTPSLSQWAGAGCWGRSLSQNWIVLNSTSTISWSTIWSVYPEDSYYGNGLMYAFSPWSGNYVVNDAIWTSAHHTQFYQIGWKLLMNTSRGMLPGGGSYISAVSPNMADFTLVLETMQGNCLRCSGGATSAQTLTFALTNGLPAPGAVLKAWQTVQGASFVQQSDVTVSPAGTITVTVPADGMLTVSTITTASHGAFPGAPIPPDAPFPMPYSDDFSETENLYDALPRYFGDQGGSFSVRHGVVQQVVGADPGPNGWGGNRDPYSLIGDRVADVAVSVDVAFHAGEPDRGDGEMPRARARNQLASVVACNASSPNQKWDMGVISPKYVSLAGDSGGVCLDNPGCGGDGTQIDFWPCVLSGGACNDDGLRWTITAGKALTTPSTDGCAVAHADGSVFVANPCVANAAGTEWAYDAATKQLMSTNPPGGVSPLCLTALPAPPPPPPPPPPDTVAYALIQVRVPNYNGKNQGFSLVARETGEWRVLVSESILANGTLPAPFNSSAWHTLALTAKGSQITASVDGAVVLNTTSTLNADAGQVAIGSGYHYASFDKFRMAPAS